MSQWILVFYNWIIWNICFFIAKRNVKNPFYNGEGLIRAGRSSYFLLFFLFGAFSLFTFYGGDQAKYKEMVESIPFLGHEYYESAMEYIYIYIALLVKGNIYLWKLIVYGTALLITYLTMRKLRLDNYVTLLFFIGFNLYSFGATRAVLGYAIYTLGLAYFCDKNLKGFIVGSLLVLASYFAHGSMLLIVILTPLCFLKLTKIRVLVSLAIFPFVVMLFNTIINNLLGGDLSVFGDYLTYKIELYAGEDSEAGTNYGAISLKIQVLLRLALLIPFMIISIKQFVRGKIDNNYYIFITMSYVVIYVSFLFYFSSINNNVYLYNRYIALTPFILYLVSSPVFGVDNIYSEKLKRFGFGLFLLGNYTFAYMTYIAYSNHTIITF